jgi:hypothetical protein
MNSILKALAIVLMASFFVQAEVPKQISYQGVLTDPSGAWVADGVYSIKFRIYDDSIGGNILWETSGYVPLQIHHGMIKHDLGSTNAIPDSIAAYPNQWVGITVNLGSELLPRTRLISVPFSFQAQHSDTAKVSLDKTIDAGELTVGTLDTARFSAYNDLASENKIGSGSDQVAAGNHVHPGVSRSIMRFEDTTTVYINIESGEHLVKSISIPGGYIKNYFRILYGVTIGNSGLPFRVRIKINGNLIKETLGDNSNPVMGNDLCIKAAIDSWLSYGGAFNLTADNGFIIEIYVLNGYGTTMGVTVGDVIVEYDVD